MKRLTSAVKSSVNPTNLQLWAIETLKTNSYLTSIPTGNIPADIKLLQKQGFQLQPSILATETNCVFLVCWRMYKIFNMSCDGFFGICIGPRTFKPVDDSRYYTNWMPGIYFWYDRTMM